MEIKVFGPGCANCTKLENMAKEAIKELGVDAKVEKIIDIKEIVKAGVLLTPGLMINGELKVTGKVPTKAEVTSYITAALK